MDNEAKMEFSLINFLYFAGGVGATVVFSERFKEYVKKRQVVITWKYFYRTLTNKKTLRLIQHPNNKPDIIIGLNNGIVPASIIATNLGIEELYYYHMFPLIDKNNCRIGHQPINERKIDLTGKRVLIVDDQSFKGDSMKSLYEHLLSMNGADPKLIKRYAVFVYKSEENKQLDIPTSGIIDGPIKKIPWSFDSGHSAISLHEKDECN